MKKLIYFSLICPIFIFSQTKVIVGKVIDNGGVPIPGASILIKNSRTGTTTDFGGNFNLSISPNQSKVLVISYLGYKTQEIDVSKKQYVEVTMVEDQTQLDEVVVVGYGTVLKKDVTGAISSVKVEDEIANQSNSIDQLLQGRAAGVQVIQNEGSVGSGISVKIRGANSLRRNNEPLYVIDGVIISSAGDDVIPSRGE